MRVCFGLVLVTISFLDPGSKAGTYEAWLNHRLLGGAT